MKPIVSGALALGLLAVQVSEANAIVCARGASRWLRRTAWRGRHASGLRLRRGGGRAASCRRALRLSRGRSRLPLRAHGPRT